MIKPLSQYDIKVILSNPVSPFYKSSLGAIQTTLKKMEDKGLVLKEEDQTSKRKKYIYKINDNGIAFFKEWMLSDFNESKWESDISNKIFFMGLMSDKEKNRIFDKAITFLNELIINYKLYYDEIDLKKLDEKSFEIAKYQVKTLELGIKHYENSLEWLLKTKEEMHNG
jgi:DNA-binding PadR family transcriptional regulator